MKDTGRPLEERTRLHLGAGLHYDPEAVNIDIAPAVNPDIVHDLNRLPWPLPSDRFESVVLRDVLEHLDNPVAILEEIHRVCRGGARAWRSRSPTFPRTIPLSIRRTGGRFPR